MGDGDTGSGSNKLVARLQTAWEGEKVDKMREKETGNVTPPSEQVMLLLPSRSVAVVVCERACVNVRRLLVFFSPGGTGQSKALNVFV